MSNTSTCVTVDARLSFLRVTEEEVEVQTFVPKFSINDLSSYPTRINSWQQLSDPSVKLDPSL